VDFARTKLEVPPPRPGLVARPRVVALLRAARAIARVEAPAG